MGEGRAGALKGGKWTTGIFCEDGYGGGVEAGDVSTSFSLPRCSSSPIAYSYPLAYSYARDLERTPGRGRSIDPPLEESHESIQSHNTVYPLLFK